MCGKIINDKIINGHTRGLVGAVLVQDKIRENLLRWFAVRP